MFSFRTTPLEDQMDKCLTSGRVAVVSTAVSYNLSTGSYIEDIFRSRGNLAAHFSPSETEGTFHAGHFNIDYGIISGCSAVVVEIQEIGARCFEYTRDVIDLMCFLHSLGKEAPSLYIVDHANPAGRVVEGTFDSKGAKKAVHGGSRREAFLLHRHGLTLGEIANLFALESGAAFPLHIISAYAYSSGKDLLPWVISPSGDVPGVFSLTTYPGMSLLKYTNVTPGIGTSRPYEYFGAPFIKYGADPRIPTPSGVALRPCRFTPCEGPYRGMVCSGFQLILTPEAGGYHSLLHALSIIRYFLSCYPEQFKLSDNFSAVLSDPELDKYIHSLMDYRSCAEYMKECEQKWMRKARKYILYEEESLGRRR